MSNFNYASIEAGARIVDFSTVVENCDPCNVLDATNDMIWLSEKGLPQWLCLSLEDVQIKDEAIIRTVGWRCWHPYKTNPRLVKLHVSPDGSKFKEWDTFTAVNPRGLTQLFCCAPISLVLYQYIAFEILDTFGGDQTYINSLYLFSDEIAQSPLVSLGEARSTPTSSVQGDIDGGEEDRQGVHHTGHDQLDQSSPDGSVDTGALLSQLGRALGLDDEESSCNSDDASNDLEQCRPPIQDTQIKHGHADISILDEDSTIFSYHNYDPDSADSNTESGTVAKARANFPKEPTAPQGFNDTSEASQDSNDINSTQSVRKPTVQGRVGYNNDSQNTTSRTMVHEITTLPSRVPHRGNLCENEDVSIASRGSQVSTRLRRLEDQIGTLVEVFQSFQQRSLSQSRCDSRNEGHELNIVADTEVYQSFETMSDGSGSTSFDEFRDNTRSTASSMLDNAVSQSLVNSVNKPHKGFSRQLVEKKVNEVESASMCNSIEEAALEESNQYQYLLGAIGRIDPLGSTSLCTEFYEDSATRLPPSQIIPPRGLTNELDQPVVNSKSPVQHRDHRYHMGTPPVRNGSSSAAKQSKMGPSESGSDVSNHSSESSSISAHVSDSLSIYEDNDPSLSLGNVAQDQLDDNGGSYFTANDIPLDECMAPIEEGTSEVICDDDIYQINVESGQCVRRVELDTAANVPHSLGQHQSSDVIEDIPSASFAHVAMPKLESSQTVHEVDNNAHLVYRVENIEGLLQAVILKLDENARNLTAMAGGAQPEPKNVPPSLIFQPLVEASAETAPLEQTQQQGNEIPTKVTYRDEAVDTSDMVWSAVKQSTSSHDNVNSSAVRGHYEKLQCLQKPGLVHRPRSTQSPPRENGRHIAPAAATQQHLLRVGLSVSRPRGCGSNYFSESLKNRDRQRDVYRSRQYFNDNESYSDAYVDESENSSTDNDSNFCLSTDYIKRQHARMNHRSVEEGRAKTRYMGSIDTHMRDPMVSARRVQYDERLQSQGGDREIVHKLSTDRRSQSELSSRNSRTTRAKLDRVMSRSFNSLSSSTNASGTEVEIADIVRRLHAKVLKRTLKEAELKALRDGTAMQFHNKKDKF